MPSNGGPFRKTRLPPSKMCTGSLNETWRGQRNLRFVCFPLRKKPSLPSKRRPYPSRFFLGIFGRFYRVGARVSPSLNSRHNGRYNIRIFSIVKKRTPTPLIRRFIYYARYVFISPTVYGSKDWPSVTVTSNRPSLLRFNGNTSRVSRTRVQTLYCTHETTRTTPFLIYTHVNIINSTS